MFAQFSDKDVVQEILYMTCHFAQKLENHVGRVFSPKQLKVNELQLMTAAEIYVCVVTFHACGYGTEVQSEMIFLVNSGSNHTGMWFSDFLGQIWMYLQITALYQECLQAHI